MYGYAVVSQGFGMSSLEDFRSEVRVWLEENCPQSMRTPMAEEEMPGGGLRAVYKNPDTKLWMDRCAEKGYTAPTWPKESGGAGLDKEQARVFQEEMRHINARTPLVGMGLSMIGPALLEFGSDKQKAEHLPKIVSGEIWWCQGHSEPGSGSDLASLRTSAEEDGDDYLINGQKIWTSGAQYADWMFALVRTDAEANKHEGISFVLFDMNQPGVTIKPIKLISGSSPFCETFLDNVKARRDDLVGEMNKGWSIGKRLLQYERSGIGGLAGASKKKDKKVPKNELAVLAKKYSGEDDGLIAEKSRRDQVLVHSMRERAFQLTARRVSQENSSGKTPGPTTSIFKLVGANLARDFTEIKSDLMGIKGIGWEGDGFSEREIESTRSWLNTRAVTIYGGTNEVQMNIIAKRVLGLPD